MSDRFRVGDYAHWVIAALFFALWSILLWNLATQKAYYRANTEYLASAAAQQPQRSVAEACSSEDTTAAIVECAEREVVARRDIQRAEYDLAAQQEMADWALGAILVNSLALLAAIVGIFYVRNTLNENRSASAAAIATAGEAKRSNELLRENSVAERRAWLSIESVRALHPTEFAENGFVFSIEVAVKNLGATPAKNAVVSVKTYYGQGSATPFAEAEANFKDSLRKNPLSLGDMLFPNDSFIQKIQWADSRDEIGEEIQIRHSGERKVGALIVFVGVGYRVVGDSSPHITYQPYATLNVRIGTFVAEGRAIDMPRMPFIAGEAD